MFLILRVIILIAALLVRQYFALLPSTVENLAVQNILLIVSWVAIWEPAHIFLYERSPIRQRQKIYEKITSMPVFVKASRRSPPFNLSPPGIAVLHQMSVNSTRNACSYSQMSHCQAHDNNPGEANIILRVDPHDGLISHLSLRSFPAGQHYPSRDPHDGLISHLSLRSFPAGHPSTGGTIVCPRGNNYPLFSPR